MNKLINKNYNFLIITLFILGGFLRFYGFNTQGYWFDEWVTLWYSNPNFEWSNFYNFRKHLLKNVLQLHDQGRTIVTLEGSY